MVNVDDLLKLIDVQSRAWVKLISMSFCIKNWVVKK